MTHHTSLPKYRPDIDGLRAVAVLFVVIFHAFPGQLRGGFIGVDIFFVISGYLISTIIFSNLEKDSFSIVGFYNRRILRIFPALILVMVSSLAFGWFTLFGDEYMQLSKHVAGGSGFVSNFVLYHESGYFDNSSVTKPMLHLWSLAIEEQFYIFWPLLMAFVWKRKQSFPGIMAVIGILSFAANLYLIAHHPVAAFYWPISRFWELMVGGLLAYVSLHKPVLIERHKQAQSTLGFLLVCAGAALINNQNNFPGWWALLPTLGAFLLISAGEHGWFNKYVLSSRPFVWIGLISYPLYLWHWPILSFIRIITGYLNGRVIRIVAIAAAMVLAWLTYRFIERPIRQKGGLRTAMVLAPAMVLVAAMALGILFDGGVVTRAAIRNSTFNEQVSKQFAGSIWAYTSNSLCLNRFPFSEAKSDSWWFCMLEKNEPPTVLLLGSSFANQQYPGLAHHPAFAKENFLSIGTCDPARVDNALRTDLPKDNPCYGERSRRKEKFLDGVISGNPTIRFAILDGLDRNPDAAYIARLKERIDFLEAHGIRAVIYQPHLIVDFDIRLCYGRPLSPVMQHCTVSVNLRNEEDARFKPLIDSIRASNPRVLFFDQNNLFCNAKECNLIRDGLPLYRDASFHISEYGSNLLAEDFATFARSSLPELVR